ncbi:MAG: zinc ABC transporter ATP-binding protein ZnuC [Kiloniellales bacterium]|nr:zinc ABC transporter ATP-binding protein ZnuC [Kiloniellales bacterium]
MTATAPHPPSRNEGPALVTAQGIDVAFGRTTVLSGVDLAVHRGEIVTLIGPNGSGKTTLVRVILGLLKPQGGEVRRGPGLTTGYVPQRLHIDPALPMTARRFLALPRRQPEDALHRVLAEVGAGYLIDQPIQSLSGGETQRLLLARALLRDPDLLVLDEPLQGVDFNGQLALFELIGGVRDERRCGILMVSHDLHLVMAGTDRVICLNHHVCCTGAPEAVSRHPEYLALFGPRGAEGLAVYTHAHDHQHDISGAVVEDRKPGRADP